jgi:chromosomal replication initiator protein
VTAEGTVTADAATVWQHTAAVLIGQVSDAVWSSTFQDVHAIGLHDDVLTVAVPSQLIRQRIEQRYIPFIEAALSDAGHAGIRLILEVKIDDVRPDFEHDVTVDLTRSTSEDPADVRTAPTRVAATPEPVGGLRYTFDSFVIGPSNRFAHAAALAVAETPARSYNPLFVYGQAGLGKTHLLQAIAQYVRDNYPTYQVRYISTETLLNEFVDAIRKNEQPEFKRRYREIDVLLVDDIQFMEGKEQLQEEFFHTFNALHEAQRQIVLSSDRPPDNIATLEDRLRTRFKMGLITDIQPPDFETRLAILRKKAEQAASFVPPEVLNYIAEHITYNIRELEGALIRVSAFATLNQAELTVQLASEILADTIKSTKPRQITPEIIIAHTAELFGLDVEQVKGRSRTRNLVHARQVAMYVCRELTDLSYPQIGREFGDRDHTTVIHAYEKVAKLMQEKQETYDDVTALIQTLLAER